MFRLRMCTQTCGYHQFLHILNVNVNKVWRKFRCSNIALGETIGLYLKELQKIYWVDTMLNTIIFITKPEVSFLAKNGYHCAKLVGNQYFVKKNKVLFLDSNYNESITEGTNQFLLKE